jgi:hypothetical protein
MRSKTFRLRLKRSSSIEVTDTININREEEKLCWVGIYIEHPSKFPAAVARKFPKLVEFVGIAH